MNGQNKKSLYDITTSDQIPTRLLVIAGSADEAKDIVRAEGHKVA